MQTLKQRNFIHIVFSNLYKYIFFLKQNASFRKYIIKVFFIITIGNKNRNKFSKIVHLKQCLSIYNNL